jgi:hypothetical protein
VRLTIVTVEKVQEFKDAMPSENFPLGLDNLMLTRSILLLDATYSSPITNHDFKKNRRKGLNISRRCPSFP